MVPRKRLLFGVVRAWRGCQITSCDLWAWMRFVNTCQSVRGGAGPLGRFLTPASSRSLDSTGINFGSLALL